MKKFIFTLLVLFAIITNVDAQYYSTSKKSSTQSTYSTNTNVRYQNGYYKSNGSYVQGHYKTRSNHTNHDNFSTQNNKNPYTGTTGSTARDYSSSALNYGSGNTIHTGSRGGQYYYNSNGNKVYVPKR